MQTTHFTMPGTIYDKTLKITKNLSFELFEWIIELENEWMNDQVVEWKNECMNKQLQVRGK